MSAVPADPPPAPAAPSLALGLAVLAFYAATSATVAPALLDGYSELAHGLAAPAARPNHLLLTPLWHALAAFGGGAAAFFHAAVASDVVAGAIALAAWHFVARRNGTGAVTALLGALALGTSHAWWSHARDVESAMVAHAFFLAAFVPAALGPARSGSVRIARGIAAGVLFALAVLFALNLVVFAPAWLLALRRPRGTGAPADRGNARIAGAVALGIGLPAFLVAHASSPGAGSFVHGLTSHSTAHLMGAVRPGASLESTARALAGAVRFFLPLDGGVPSAVKRLLVGEPALAVSPRAAAEFALASGLLLAGVLLVVRRPAGARAPRPLDHAALVTLAIGTLVNVAWLGSDPQFWLPVLPVVAWYALRDRDPFARGSARRLAAAAVLVLAALNFAWPSPTRVAPAGGGEWKSARAFAAERTRPTLLLGAETPWSFFAAAPPSRIVRRSWLYAPDGAPRTGAAGLFAEVDSALAAGSDVLVEDLEGPDDLRRQGMWENVGIALGVTRSDLARAFATRYSRVDLPRPPGDAGSLQRLSPRTGPSAGPPSRTEEPSHVR